MDAKIVMRRGVSVSGFGTHYNTTDTFMNVVLKVNRYTIVLTNVSAMVRNIIVLYFRMRCLYRVSLRIDTTQKVGFKSKK